MIVAVTGHRPPKLGGYYLPNRVHDAVVEGLTRKLTELAPERVFSGMALGVDQWACQVCLDLDIPYEAIIPFPNFDARWPDASKQQYQYYLHRAQTTFTVSNGPYQSGLLQQRNRWMVNHSDTLLAVWNGSTGGTANCINYALQVGKPIVHVDLPADVWEAAADYERRQLARQSLRQYESLERARNSVGALLPPPVPPLEQVLEHLRDITGQVGTTTDATNRSIQSTSTASYIPIRMEVSTPAEEEKIPHPLEKPKTGRIINLDD